MNEQNATVETQQEAVIEETPPTTTNTVSDNETTPEVSEPTTEETAEVPAETDKVEAETEDSAEAKDDVEVSEGDAEGEDLTILSLKKGQYFNGTVKNITEFGVFVDIGIPQDGLVHISQLARQKVEKASDVVSSGDKVDVWVKKVDRKRGRISLTMIRPIKYRLKDLQEEMELEGTVTRLETYGAFIDIGSQRDGLVHISEITHEYINHPQDALEVGKEVQVKVLKVDRKKRQVDLSIRALLPPPAPKESPEDVDLSEESGSERRQPQQRARQSEEFYSNYNNNGNSNGKQGGRRKKKKQEPIMQLEDSEPMVTAMAAAFSGMFEDDEEFELVAKQAQRKGNIKKRGTKKRRQLEDLLDETLAGS